MVEAVDRRARHQKTAQHPVLDCFDGLSENAFIVVCVPAIQVYASGALEGWIESHRKEVGQNLLANALGESLAFGLVLLAVAFDAVPENFMKEHARCPAGKNGGARAKTRPR